MANEKEAKAKDEGGVLDLVKGAVKDAQELVKIEVALAKNEVKQDVMKVKGAAIAFAVGFATAVLTVAMLLVAIVVAIGGPAPALVIAAILLVTSGGAGFLGYKLLPREAPLDDTKENVEKHARILKEKIA